MICVRNGMLSSFSKLDFCNNYICIWHIILKLVSKNVHNGMTIILVSEKYSNRCMFLDLLTSIQKHKIQKIIIFYIILGIQNIPCLNICSHYS